MQWLFGQSVVGELLLNSLFIATGCVLVAVLARRITGSLGAAIITGSLALFALPRAYDYDKVLFYPLGIWMAWRWLDRPTPRRLFLLSLTLVIAGLYRYDNGVFLGTAILAGVVVDRWRQPRQLVTRAGAFVLMTALVSLPGLLFIETHGGVGNAIDQSG
jgi:4-amino-4-deoxy-L-arabinose transferase-like glycosyltransferase